MSSLMQHHGGRSADGRKVELLCYRVVKGADWDKYNGPGAYNPSPDSTTFCDDVELDASGNPRLYRFYRRPKGMFGCWVVFQFNSADQVPDLSCPMALLQLPRDAKPLTDEESASHWKS